MAAAVIIMTSILEKISYICMNEVLFIYEYLHHHDCPQRRRVGYWVGTEALGTWMIKKFNFTVVNPIQIWLFYSGGECFLGITNGHTPAAVGRNMQITIYRGWNTKSPTSTIFEYSFNKKMYSKKCSRSSLQKNQESSFLEAWSSIQNIEIFFLFFVVTVWWVV